MPLTFFAATLVVTTAVVTAGCGGVSDPVGTVPPDQGNLTSPATDDGDDPATSSGGASSGRLTPPKWTDIYNSYLVTGTIGNCVICHAQMRTASGAYSYLQSTAYINGTGSLLAKAGSCLSWYGGDMPPGGTHNNAMAVSDLDAWAAAGAMNN
jgi:hypothetical protein